MEIESELTDWKCFALHILLATSRYDCVVPLGMLVILDFSMHSVQEKNIIFILIVKTISNCSTTSSFCV